MPANPAATQNGPRDVARDPVCGMVIQPHGAPYRREHAGESYFFCSAGCAEKSAAEPAKYLAADNEKPLKPPSQSAFYTCPMHPQIRQVGPGNCPICGMALEPEIAVPAAAENPELVDMRRRFPVRLTLSISVLVLEMGGHLAGLHLPLPQSWSNWLQFLLATPVVLWGGWPFFLRGWQSLRNRNLNMFTLIAMGTGVAWVYSVVAILMPGLFPPG